MINALNFHLGSTQSELQTIINCAAHTFLLTNSHRYWYRSKL